jgi:hypothetical protein
MVTLADFGSGQVLLSMIYFFLFFIWIWLLITIFADIFRSSDLSGWGKALWSIFVIVLPFLGIFMYLIVRGGKMHERALAQAQAQDTATREYIRSVSGGSGGASGSPADQLAQLADLHAKGVIDDAEFTKLKAKVAS